MKFAITCRSRLRASASPRSRATYGRCASTVSCRKTGCRPTCQKSRKRRGTGAPGARRAALPNFGGDPETEFFLDSVAEDLITELGCAHWFSIVARNTSFNYKGNAADSKQIARELGVRCVVEGSLGEAGSRSGSVASS